MRVAPNPVLHAVPVKDAAKVRSQQWPAFFKSLVVPILVLVFFAAAPHWLNRKVHSHVAKAINADNRLTQDQKNAALERFSGIDFAAVSRGDSPEFADWRASLVKGGITYTFEYLGWAFYCSVALVGVVVVASGIILVLGLAAKTSRSNLIRCYRLGWHISMAAACVQLLLLMPLITFAAYELPVLAFNKWYPQLVVCIVIIGAGGLLGSLAILFRKVPLQFNEPMSRRVTPEQAPELWQAIRHAAARLQTAPPDNIIIGIQLNFYVTELAVSDGRELAQGRTLYLSYPLLRQLPQEEVVAVIGHELGHFMGDDTRLTREFYPFKLKAHATQVNLAKLVLVGWTSLQFLTFFNWCFGETERGMSRKRELLADQKSAVLTTPTIAARALVRFHVLLEAFQQGLVDTVRKGAQSPLDVPLYTVVREKLPSGVAFWTELFEKKLPHPLDTHPALHVRLAALGQTMDARAAEALATQETQSAYAGWFANRDGLFTDLRRQADEVVQKMQSKSRILDADYDTAEGRALLDRQFPEVKWPVQQSRITALMALFALVTVGAGFLAMLLRDINISLAIGFGVVSVLPIYGGAILWLRYSSAVFTVNAGGITFSGWKRPLRFKDVAQLSGRKANSALTLTFRLKNPQLPIWKYSLLGHARKSVSFSLTSLGVSKQVAIANVTFRYFTRQTEEK